MVRLRGSTISKNKVIEWEDKEGKKRKKGKKKEKKRRKKKKEEEHKE